MLSLIGYGLLGIVAAIGVVALLVLVLPADHLAVAPRDVVPSGLPSGPEINSTDVTRVRLPVTLRGYRMVDTDAVLDRLAIELLRREEEIDELRRAAGLGPRPPWRDTDHGNGFDSADEVLDPQSGLQFEYASVGSPVEVPYAAGDEGTHPVGPAESHSESRHANDPGTTRYFSEADDHGGNPS